MREAFSGIDSLEQLQEALKASTAVQREEDQRDKVHEALIKVSAFSLTCQNCIGMLTRMHWVFGCQTY